MNNRIFNVNGEGMDMLQDTLRLAFRQDGMNTAWGFVFDDKKGMILLWTSQANATPFPVRLDADAVTQYVWDWLETKPEIECVDWDTDDVHHDVETELGWRVYCEDWGHVGKERKTICAIKPAYLWFGK